MTTYVISSQLLSHYEEIFVVKVVTRELEYYWYLQTIYTTAQHPQTDELVERFNRCRTLTDMFAKSTELNDKNWNEKLSYVLFAYKLQPTGESSFQLHA